jgi:putative flippase GtrA
MIGSVLVRGGAQAPLTFALRTMPLLVRFGAVGGAGLIVNQGLLWALVGLGEMHYLLAATLATAGSSTFNFVGTESWVFRGRKQADLGGLGARFAAYTLVNSGALLVRLPLLYALTSGLHIHYLLSNVITLAALMLVRYAIADGWIWSGSATAVARR